MRRFTDADGATWDVVIGRESWGTLVALFAPAGPERRARVRQAVLAATTHEAAEREIEAMDESALRRLLERATDKEI